MDLPLRQSGRLLWAGVALTVALVGGLLFVNLVGRAGGKPLPDYGSIGDFGLTNQDGQAVSLATLRGHVWVADIIFTRCPGPCLKMSQQMAQLQESLPAASQARLVTLTTDPDFDTPPILKIYANRFGANPERWIFLTGTKKQIGNLAIDSLKLTALPKTAQERQSPDDLFVHSTIFVLVDKAARLRGIYETAGESVDSRQVITQLLEGVKRLEREG
ncbi:MAG TPA: SCO family protein [Verrucomicrobiae bacterium]|nr:SCO family protein [Verrucomicrobiae bacterium]